MEVINTTVPDATQNSGLYIVVYCMFVYRIVLLSVVVYLNIFFCFSVNFVIFSLRATILINLNLNLNHVTGEDVGDAHVPPAG